MKLPRLTIIVPCYNEEPVLPKSSAVLGTIMDQLIRSQKVAADSKILFVDDGSHDHTWQLIGGLEKRAAKFTGIKFSRNFGHQNALMAGMATAEQYSDIVITIDADLQDDPQLIPAMITNFMNGSDIVLGVRNDRRSDSAFKRLTAENFYRFMRAIGVQLVPNHADFRLLSQRAVHELMKYRETNPFLRGIVPQLGFPTTKLFYKRQPRFAGESKYPFKKMLKFALDGITSFSIAPIKVIMLTGVGVIGIGLLMMLYTLGLFFLGGTVSGWTSLMISLWFIGGAQLLAVSVVGEYIGKIFSEVKQRPRYIVQEDDYSTKFQQTHYSVRPIRTVSHNGR